MLSLFLVVAVLMSFVISGPDSGSSMVFHLLGWAFLLAYVLVEILLMMEIRKSGEKVREYDLASLAFPLFMILWVPISIVSLFRKNCGWKHMEHDRDVRIEDMK